LQLEDKFINFIVLVLKVAGEKKQNYFVDTILKFIHDKILLDTDFSIKVLESLLKEFKTGKINRWASELLEVFQEIKQIEEREKSKQSLQ